MLIIVILLLLLVFGLPVFPYSAGWGYNPAGIILFVLVIVLLLRFL
jgi:hypothetical protein